MSPTASSATARSTSSMCRAPTPTRDRLGAASLPALLRAAGRVHAPRGLRQAGNGHARPRPGDGDPRGADGRRASRHGRRRQRPRRDHGARRRTARLLFAAAHPERTVGLTSRAPRSASARTPTGPGASSPSTNSRSTSRPFRRAGGPAGRFHASRRASGTSNGVVPGSGGSRSMPPRREHGQASPGWLSGSISATSRRRSTFRRSSFTRPTIRSAT